MKTKIKIATIFTFLLASCVFFAAEGNTQTQPPAPTAQVETAGQKFKNIKVLNDLPADQLGKVMNLMSASLGVRCTFCHVSGETDFDKDGKEEKEAAREMIKMTLELNKAHFKGRPEISCNTCHNGRSHPQSAPNLNPAAPEERPKQPDVKPTTDQILAKYEAAVGGRENLAKVKSRAIRASRVEADGKTTEAEEIWQKGLKLSIATAYPKAVVTETFDGTNAAKRAGTETIALKADEAEQIKREAQILSFADLKSVYSKLDYRFTDKLDGREVYLVLGTTADNSRERLYFDAQTGLLVRRSSVAMTMLGPFVYQVDYADYKDFGGVKLPTTISYAVPNIRWTRKLVEVKNNAAVDDAKFGTK